MPPAALRDQQRPDMAGKKCLTRFARKVSDTSELVVQDGRHAATGFRSAVVITPAGWLRLARMIKAQASTLPTMAVPP